MIGDRSYVFTEIYIYLYCNIHIIPLYPNNMQIWYIDKLYLSSYVSYVRMAGYGWPIPTGKRRWMKLRWLLWLRGLTGSVPRTMRSWWKPGENHRAMYTCTYRHIYMYMYTYTYTHIYIYCIIYMCAKHLNRCKTSS